MQIHGARKTHIRMALSSKSSPVRAHGLRLCLQVWQKSAVLQVLFGRGTPDSKQSVSEAVGRTRVILFGTRFAPSGKKSKDHAGNPQGYATIMIVDCRIEFCNGSTLQPTDFRPEDMVRRIKHLASRTHPAVMPTAVLRSYCLSLALRWTKPMGRLGDLLRLKI